MAGHHALMGVEVALVLRRRPTRQPLRASAAFIALTKAFVTAANVTSSVTGGSTSDGITHALKIARPTTSWHRQTSVDRERRARRRDDCEWARNLRKSEDVVVNVLHLASHALIIPTAEPWSGSRTKEQL
jgi:hypothetical protein